MPGKGPAGLTLIEMVVAIVVIGLAVSAVLAMLAQGFRGSPDAQLRIKTVELAQAYMEEIFEKKFDHNVQEASRDLYDDLEDYDGLQEGEACGWGSLLDSEGNSRSGRYQGYCVEVAVTVDAGPLADVDAGDAKRIDLTITDPRGFDTTFAAYRLDF